MTTETTCEASPELYRLSQERPDYIGHFVWTGMDYLGEAAMRGWSVEAGEHELSAAGWLSSGIGCADITGRLNGQALFTRVALEKDNGPWIVVTPVGYKKRAGSLWRMTHGLPSWAWQGCKGRTAEVEVYANANCVQLFLNDRKVGEKKGTLRFEYHVPWEPGILTAVALDEQGR